MAKQIKERIKCNDCRYKGEASTDHLNYERKPILCKCKKYPYLVLINEINKDCEYNEEK